MPARVNGLAGEVLEYVSYAPGRQTSGDLELATKTITATSEPANPDYSATLTLPAPSNSRWQAHLTVFRLSVTIDSFGGGGAILNYRIKRGGVSLATGQLSTGASTGQKLVAGDIISGATGAHLYELFLWVDAGSCVISEVTIMQGFGTCNGTPGTAQLSFGPITGMFQVTGQCSREGTGNYTAGFGPEASGMPGVSVLHHNTNAATTLIWGYSTRSPAPLPYLYAGQRLYFYINNVSVATDLAYIHTVNLTLRRIVQ